MELTLVTTVAQDPVVAVDDCPVAHEDDEGLEELINIKRPSESVETVIRQRSNLCRSTLSDSREHHRTLRDTLSLSEHVVINQ